MWKFCEDKILYTLKSKTKSSDVPYIVVTSGMSIVNIAKCMYWLDTHSAKVWWRYVLSNTNAVHFCDFFCDIGQFFRPSQINSLKNQKFGDRQHTKHLQLLETKWTID